MNQLIHFAATSVGDGVDDALNNGGLANDTDLINPVQMLLNTFVGLVAVVAVVMIIMGGVQYSTSQGESGKVKKAKDTIMYGIIGLVVAILAFSIINFVLASIF